jgi:hypothetical protein
MVTRDPSNMERVALKERKLRTQVNGKCNDISSADENNNYCNVDGKALLGNDSVNT